MKKLLLPFICFFGFISLGSAQSLNDIQQWQSRNPDKILMKQDVFNQLSKGKQEKISERVVFIENLTQEFLASTYKSDSSPLSDMEEQTFIKEWLAQHPDIKIVNRSVFIAADSQQQENYLNLNCLILKGEEITVEDIENYSHLK